MRIRFLDILFQTVRPFGFVEWAAVGAGLGAIGLVTGINASNRAADAAEGLQATQLGLQDRQLDITERQLELAEASWDRYLEIFDPLERGIVAGLEGGPDTEGAINAARGDVTSAYDGAVTRFGDRLSSYGIDPGSGRFGAISRGMELDRARSEVQAINQARRSEEDQHFSRQLAAASMGRNLPSQASSFMSSAGAGINAASANYGQAAGQQFQMAGQYGQDVAGSLYAIGRSANQFSQPPAIQAPNVENSGWDSNPYAYD